MVYSFDCLRHYTVVCGYYEYSDICRIRTTHTHGCESLMSRCIKESDLPAVDAYDISTDFLGDTAGLFIRYVSMTDLIEE